MNYPPTNTAMFIAQCMDVFLDWAILYKEHKDWDEAIAMDNALENECWKCNGTDKLSENYGIHLKDSDVYHTYNMYCRLG